MKYGHKSKLREECSRFLRFSYLLDFLAMEALSNIYLNSIREVVLKLTKLNTACIELGFKSSKASTMLAEPDENAPARRDIRGGPEPLFALRGIF